MKKNLLLLSTLLLTLFHTAQADVTVVTASSPSGWRTGASANTITFSPAFSFTPGTNGMLIVTISGELTPNNPSVTYNGTPMTQGVASNQTNSGNNGSYASIWYLANPAVGSGALVVTTGGAVSRYNVYATYATGVVQGVPEAGLGASFTSLLEFETGFITPTPGALAITVLGGSVSGTGNSYSSSLHTSAGALAGQTTLAQPSSDNSIAAASYRVVADNTPLKGRGTQTSTNLNQPESVVIASFAALASPPPPPPVADTDGDGLLNAVETNTGIFVSATDTGTNPLVADTDGDSVGDWFEVTATSTNPNSAASKTRLPYPLPAPDSSTGVTNKPVKVFIIMGQSNMLGRGAVEPIGTLGTLATTVTTERKFPNLLNSSGGWAVRSDVNYRAVFFPNNVAPLAPGLGAGPTQLGPELGFGHVMGYHLDEPVLLIKAAVGGQSLSYNFLPPSSQRFTVNGTTYAGYRDSPSSWPEGTTPVPNASQAGKLYDDSVTSIKNVLNNFNANYPSYAAQGYQIAGFHWFQGFADLNPVASSRYELNMVNFIKDIRRDLNATASTPFVISTLGQYGRATWNGEYTAVVNAQLAMNDPLKYPEFVGNVRTVESRDYVRSIAQSPTNDGAHYNQNAETYMLVGEMAGRAMVDLLSSNSEISRYEITAASPQPAGVAFDITVTAKRIDNTTVNDSTKIVTLTSPTAGSQMEFDWNGDGIYGDNTGTLIAGVKTIKARNKAAQTVTLIAADGIATTTPPPSVTTVAGAFNRLQILAPGETAAPGTVTGKIGTPGVRSINTPFNVTVNAVDADWNLINTVTDTVGITSTNSTATLPSNAALVAGTRTFSITLNATGNFTVTATDLTDASKTAAVTPAITMVLSDTDGDGLPDTVETNTGILVSPTNTGTNPLVADTDGDGVGDWFEVTATSTNPNSAASKTRLPYPLPAPNSSTGATNKPVKVFIIMGQSNMLGRGAMGPIGTPGTLATTVTTERKFPNLLNSSGGWSVRNDVNYRAVFFPNNVSSLTAGLGASNTQIGPELGFGHVMGYYMDEPVLLIKAAMGSQSLAYNFLPPSSQRYTVNGTTYAGYRDSPGSWPEGTTPVPDTTQAGKFYDDTVTRIKSALNNFNTSYPSYAAQGYQIAGFHWFQGFSDLNPVASSRYELNMANFIKDIRSDFNAAASTPFVISTLGQYGRTTSNTNYVAVVNAQLAMNDAAKYPEFVGNVRTVESRDFVRSASQSPGGDGSNYNYNAETSMLVGEMAGRAMVDLIATSLEVARYEITAPSPQPAVVAFDVTLTAKNSYNSTVNDSTAVVTLTSPTAGSQMEFDWNGDGSYGDNSGTLTAGVKTLKARNIATQTVTLIATDGTATTTPPPSVTTVAGAFAQLQILAPGETAAPGTITGKTGIPGVQMKNTPFNVTVNAVDANWNPVNTVTDTVGITSTNGSATLPPDAALLAGTRSFAITLNTTGNFTVTATDLTDASKTAATTAAITVETLEIPGVNIYGEVPGLAPSNQYSVRLAAAADTSVFRAASVLQTICQAPSAADGSYYGMLTNWSHSYANFEMTVPVTVEITRLSGPITSAVVHPARKSGGVVIANGKAYVTLNDPSNVHVDINGQMDTQDTGFLKGRGPWNGPPIHTLSIHANPVLAGKPTLSDPSCYYVSPGTTPPTSGPWTTLYFLPGIHDIGIAYPLEKDHRYYIPGDAFVTGTFNSGPWGNGTNIRIFGHGTLSMAGIPHPGAATPPPTDFNTYHPIDIRGAFSTGVEGITIADPAYHAIQMPADYSTTRSTTSSWVKIFGWRANGDGINPFSNGRISNCFIRTQDDCSYVTGAGMNDNVFWNDANGSSFVFNSVPNLTGRTLLIEDCDVIYSRASWINWNGGRVFNMRGEAGGAGGAGIEFRNILISDPRPTMQTFHLCMETFAPYDNTPQSRTAGHLSGIKFTDVTIAARNPNNEPEILWGASSGLASIQNLTFDNLKVGGVTVLADIFKQNGHVQNLVFIDSTPVWMTAPFFAGEQFNFSVLDEGSYVGTPGATEPSIFNVINNGAYTVEASTTLAGPASWAPIHTSTAPFNFTDSTQLPSRFYRVVKPKP